MTILGMLLIAALYITLSGVYAYSLVFQDIEGIELFTKASISSICLSSGFQMLYMVYRLNQHERLFRSIKNLRESFEKSTKTAIIDNSVFRKFFVDSIGPQVLLGILFIADGYGFIPGSLTGDIGSWIGIGLVGSAFLTSDIDIFKTRISRDQSGE
jgi:hypothetical protein